MKDNKHMQNFNEHQENLNIADVSGCALSIRKVLKQLQNEMKNNKHQHEYSEYLKQVYVKMSSAMIYAQELQQHSH